MQEEKRPLLPSGEGEGEGEGKDAGRFCFSPLAYLCLLQHDHLPHQAVDERRDKCRYKISTRD